MSEFSSVSSSQSSTVQATQQITIKVNDFSLSQMYKKSKNWEGDCGFNPTLGTDRRVRSRVNIHLSDGLHGLQEVFEEGWGGGVVDGRT